MATIPSSIPSQPFQGVIEEIPYICVDYFLDLKTTLALFLSHCHTDHMKGLDSLNLYEFVQSNKGIFIYCSNATKNILAGWETYSKLNPYLKALEINQTTKINLPSDDLEFCISQPKSFCVTLVPTGHCPGSVMFLYEGNFGTVLYTGDFRLSKGDGRKCKAFMANPSRPEYGLKTLDHIYLDCTFCSNNAKKFPPREVSVRATIALISDWIAKGHQHKVILLLAGRGFGAEFIFVEIFKKLKLKVHTTKFKHDVYRTIPEIRNVISEDKNCSIHACMDSNRNSACIKDFHKLLKIRLTTQWHLMEGNNRESKPLIKERDVYRVLYSMHSSLEEVQDLVYSLKPTKITPIAKPDDVSIDELSRLLDCIVTTPVQRLSSICYKRKRSSSGPSAINQRK